MAENKEGWRGGGSIWHKMLKNNTRAPKFFLAINKSCYAYASKSHPVSSKFEAFMPWFIQKVLMRGSLYSILGTEKALFIGITDRG